MAWPTNNGTQQLDVASAWETGRLTVTRVKHLVTSINSLTPLDTNSIVALASVLGNTKERLAEVATVDVAALTAYARSQINNQTFDVSVELPSIRAAVDSLFDWIVTNTPQDADNYLLLVKYNSFGGLQWRTLTGAQETAIKARLATFLAAVD